MAQERMDKVVIVTEPTIAVIAEQVLNNAGIKEMTDWVRRHRPNCGIPEKYTNPIQLLPHDAFDIPNDVEYNMAPPEENRLKDNEILCELAGRKCYDSFGDAAGKPTNEAYLKHIMDVNHASVLYHAKMTFFFGGISRRLSHELIRTYVGADRENDGSPSQESTRFTYHYGHYIASPRTLEDPERLEEFRKLCQKNYDDYCDYVDSEREKWQIQYQTSNVPTIERKRIFEDAAGRLLMQAETSLIWTTNPMALTKQILERTSQGADAEYQRFARLLAGVCVSNWPNLFPESIHKIASNQ